MRNFYQVQLFHLTSFPSPLRPQEMQSSISSYAQIKEKKSTKYKAPTLIPTKSTCITGVPDFQELLQYT